MKICFLSSMHPPFDKRVFDKEAVTLAQEGHEVIHLCPGEKRENGNFKGVTVITYPRPKGIKGRLRQFFDLYKKAKATNADVYHCNEVDSWIIGVALRIFQRKICVFDVHEHYPSTFSESRFPPWLRPAVAWVIRQTFRLLTPFTARIVLAKETVADDFKCAEHKKILVRNFTPLKGLNLDKALAETKSSSNVTIVHFGLFNKLRGWPQLLSALHLMRDKTPHLTVVGEFNDGTKDEFLAEAQKLGLIDRITVNDWMPFEDAFQILARAHIGLIIFQPGIQNHVYAMPHKMFDYMSARMAVICPSFAVEVAPIVQSSGCGLLIDSSSAADLSEKLDYLMANPDIRQKMGQAGREAVLKDYNWESESVRLKQIYLDLSQ
ncbi:glycosyltransferase [Pigmentiphaga sp. YJ18]|uniref:glycosyltransferase n=1 Tax=Pigmentiphaga sp. YJ18 TaxID=3134907 RepID=UPI0031139402